MPETLDEALERLEGVEADRDDLAARLFVAHRVAHAMLDMVLGVSLEEVGDDDDEEDWVN